MGFRGGARKASGKCFLATKRVRFRTLLLWSGREDLNLRPSEPHSDALPGCATPRARYTTTATAPRATGRAPARRPGAACGARRRP
jgi:hypothetical protein